MSSGGCCGWRRRLPRHFALAVGFALVVAPAAAQSPADWGPADHAIAAKFAPVFHQGMVGTRFDFITNFDFDGDWVGDNNWANAGDPATPQRAYVYYAVSETPTHYFVHYAAFHPRDYKGGELTGALLSRAARRGAKASTRVRKTSIADDVVLAHENDLEGCLVVAEKRGARLEDAEVVLVETLAHNRYLKFRPDPTLTDDVGALRVEHQQPLLYIEPKGHGMEAYADQERRSAVGDEKSATLTGGRALPEPEKAGIVQRAAELISGLDRTRKLVNLERAEQVRVYRYTGTADDPEKVDGDVGYALVSLLDTMWARSRSAPNETFGAAQDYGAREVIVAGGGPATRRTVRLGSIGSSFRGVQGAENMARPPWGWFDMSERNRPLGEWFFDPATVVQRHFPALNIETAYVHQPFLGLIRPTGYSD